MNECRTCGRLTKMWLCDTCYMKLVMSDVYESKGALTQEEEY